jgi:regulator of protease activity HflC (stomatin/prohibitin superfamily)
MNDSGTKLLLLGGLHIMKTTIINENQKGLLFKNGKYIKLLDAGKYYLFGGRTVETHDLKQSLVPSTCDLETLLADKTIADSVAVVEVGDEELALHYVNGRFSSALRHGKYAFWSIADSHEFKIVDISSPMVDKSVPEYIFSKLPQLYYSKIEVAEHQKAMLYFNQKLEKILDAGTYYFWKTSTKVDVRFVDTRLTQMNITGQEILTADKVALRINFVCSYRVTDFVKITSEIDNFAEQIHVAAQLALREYVGKYKLDEILENKEQMTEFVFARLKAKEKELFVEIADAGVKDIILPGDIREMMNTVLIAEKRAQANVITRREEVASTRSLLNTAKLMDENQTLYKLKELEYIERICENVGNISLNGNVNILTQLAQALSGNNV